MKTRFDTEAMGNSVVARLLYCMMCLEQLHITKNIGWIVKYMYHIVHKT